MAAKDIKDLPDHIQENMNDIVSNLFLCIKPYMMVEPNDVVLNCVVVFHAKLLYAVIKYFDCQDKDLAEEFIKKTFEIMRENVNRLIERGKDVQ